MKHFSASLNRWLGMCLLAVGLGAQATHAQNLPAAPASALASVPEASNYRILYQVNVPNTSTFNSSGVTYAINNASASLPTPARVAYYLELTNSANVSTYVWASMNNFASTLTQLGIPNPASNNVNWHQNVTGLNVYSNVTGVTTGSNLGTGRVEMWHTDYSAVNVDAVPGASGSTFDFGDQSISGNYGSFQVHNVTAAQTVLAYNNWGNTGNASDLGIGNQPAGGASIHPDWTFAYNAGGYTVKRLTILVQVPNNALAFDGADDYVDLGTATTNLPSGNANFTYENWYYNPGGQTGDRWLAWFGAGIANGAAIIGYDGATGKVKFNHLASGNDLTSNVVLPIGRWSHLAVVWRGAALQADIYLNGVLAQTLQYTQAMVLPTSGSFQLGTFGSSPTYCVNGRLDAVRLYTTALTTAQVQADMYSTTAAVPGSQVAYYNFNQGTAGGTNTGITSLTDQSNSGNTGTLTNFALTGTASNWVRSFPTITGITPTTGTTGTNVTVSGTNLTDATGFAFNGVATTNFTTPTSDLTTTITVPLSATSGPVSLSSATLTLYNGPVFTVQYPDLVVTTTTSIPAIAYNSITVNSGGIGTLVGNVLVNNSTTINNGAVFNDGCAMLAGAGTFTLAAGGTLGICSAQGISANGATGSIQNTGARSFDADALYTYNGAAAQVAGSGLPASVRTLTLANSGSGLTLTNALTVTTAATLTTGVLTTGANALTLGSAATLSETTTGYATGTVQTTRALNTAGNSESFGGLGLTLTPSGSTLPGSTFVARTTGTARTGVGTSTSVKRTFDIQPTVNAGLNVALALTVRDDERNNIAATNLKLFRSKDSGATWQPAAGATATATTTNGVSTYTASVSGIGDFSIWTLGDATNPLPVQLVAFTAQAREATVALAWRTASETNSARFEVERSLDGRTFALVGTVAAAGTSLVPRAYELLDSKLPAGAKLLYYRLRQVDLDGTAAYSQVQTVATGKQGLALYPNPAGRTTTLSGAAAGAPVQVYDAVGTLVLTATADADGAVVLTLPSSVPGGIYLVRSGAGPALRLTLE